MYGSPSCLLAVCAAAVSGRAGPGGRWRDGAGPAGRWDGGRLPALGAGHRPASGAVHGGVHRHHPFARGAEPHGHGAVPAEGRGAEPISTDRFHRNLGTDVPLADSPLLQGRILLTSVSVSLYEPEKYFPQTAVYGPVSQTQIKPSAGLNVILILCAKIQFSPPLPFFNQAWRIENVSLFLGSPGRNERTDFFCMWG